MNDSCLFCAHLNSLQLLYEDDRIAVALHEDWAVRGHAMVVWKAHVENIAQLSENEAGHFARIYRSAERVLLEVTGADRAIMLKLGIITPHLHVHIYPLSAALDRARVMDIIEGRVREEVSDSDRAEFVRAVRARLDFRRPPE
jgi:diadenosine tetraphosphate (Ap4A) HIT family hydrolase